MNDRAERPRTALHRREVLGGAGALGVAALGLAPSLAAAGALSTLRIEAHNHVVSLDHIDGREVRPAWLHWSPERVVADMDQRGADRALLSFATPCAGTSAPGRERNAARRCNEQAAKTASDHPGRFTVLAGLPPPTDVDGALLEIAYAYDVLHARGLTLMTSYGEHWLTDPAFGRVWEELNRREAVVFVQPSIPPFGDAIALRAGSRAAQQRDAAGAVARLARDGALRRIRFIASRNDDRPVTPGVPVRTYWWGRLPHRTIAQSLEPRRNFDAA